MGAKKIEYKKSSNTKLHLADFDRDSEARRQLNAIIDSEARAIYPREAAWYLGASESQVYTLVPRIKSLGAAVRFDPAVLKQLKNGFTPHVSSLKTEKTQKNAGPKHRSRLKNNRERLWE